MNTHLTEEQQLLKDSVKKFCESEAPLESIREWTDIPEGLPNALWAKLAEQGWLAIMVPEDLGGLGLGVTDLATVCEQMGRNLLPGPFLSTVLAGHAIMLGGSDTLQGKYVEGLVTGETIGTIALLDEDGQLSPESIATTAEKSGDGYTLNGKKYLVPDVGAATMAIVAAKTEDGVTLFAVDLDANGVSTELNKLTDETSRSGQIVLDNVSVNADAVVGTPGQGWEVVEPVLEVANVCLAAECVAGSERILTKTIEYAKERTQFGKLIGSFQAVKHPLADLYALVESARSAYHYAAWAVDENAEDKKSAVAVARITAAEAYRKTTLDCLQAHGGIGFTWEYDLHLFLKRAKHNQYLYGDTRDYEELVASEALGI